MDILPDSSLHALVVVSRIRVGYFFTWFCMQGLSWKFSLIL